MRSVVVTSAIVVSLGFGVVIPPGAASPLYLEQLAAGLENPTAVVAARDGSGRLFIALQRGRILVRDRVRVLPTPFLDLTTLVSCCGERGLLSVAFHPDYAANGFFYVNYTNLAGDTVVARYSRDAANPQRADPASATVLLTIAQPYANHNGGQLAFGPDGYLYIGTGDGGSAGDPENRAQDLAQLLGKILRIDVDGGSPYAIPADNPFQSTPGAAPEIWSYGLRNPWRFGFDRLTGDLFIADVGQGSWEEVNLQSATSTGGENYGWRRMEGSHCYDPVAGCNDGTLVLPLLEYGHSAGNCSVTGGYRCRGSASPSLSGAYLYGDFCSGRIWSATPAGADGWMSIEVADLPYQISTFGEDETGELLVATHGVSGRLYRLASAPPPPTSSLSGDFDGDGRADVAGRTSVSGSWWVGVSSGTGFASAPWGAWSPLVEWQDVVLGDFSGDGRADIAGRAGSSGAWWVAVSTGSGFVNQFWGSWAPSLVWRDVTAGDFNGDGRADIAGRVEATGQWWVAVSTGSSFSNQLWGSWSPMVVWRDVRAGDFDGDGKADLVGRVDSSGQWWVATSSGTSFSNALWGAWDPTMDWRDVRVADFSGDGRADVAGRDAGSGCWWTSESTGGSFVTTVWGAWSPSVTWADVRAVDFTGDGRADLAGRVAMTGQWWVAVSSGIGFTNALWTTWAPSAAWADVRVADYSGDGRADLAGHDASMGGWWVGRSSGDAFANALWTAWSTFVTWVDVR